jgi:predicted branched-subunit amino acid permease
VGEELSEKTVDNTTKSMWLDGARSVSPILIGVAPFGLIFGVTAANSDVPTVAAWASSFIVFAGAAQLSIIEVLGTGGAAIVAIFTAIVINSRHLMYSADMGRYTANEPMWRKVAMAYLLTDQAYLISSHRFRDPSSSRSFSSFYFGAALTLWITWQITTTAGFLVGASIPESWSLEFAIPLTFLALLVVAVKDKPGLVAAATGGIVALAGIGLPYHLGLVAGALAGVAAGVATEKWAS